MATKNSRALACKVLFKVIQEGHAFSPNVVREIFPDIAPRDYAFIAHLCFGVLRFYYTLDAYLKTILDRPLKTKESALRLLILIGLYQLFYTDTPPYAAVHETVQAAHFIKKSWAKAFVNGILRKALQEKPQVLLSTNTSHPAWLQQAFEKAWPSHWKPILQANQTHPPLTLRVNTTKIAVKDYCLLLEKNNFTVTQLPYSPEGIIIAPEVNVEEIPGFFDGLVSVQDGASQLAAHLLMVNIEHRVLDACAAPGGKTAHILETGCQITAIEKDSERMKRLQATLARLSLCAEVIGQDAADCEQWWNGQWFDRILLDAPCSATGIIRRHPDIKNHRKYEDIAPLLAEQARLLNHLWPLLKPNGILLYSTCSILPAENVQQITHFIKTHPDAQECPIEENWGIAQDYGRQILPGEGNMDGFYYARLRKAVPS